jgi:NAD(P) transhydrogenase subunit alpha
MKLAILTEQRDGEPRVAASPDTVKKLVALGVEVAVESGAGTRADMTDEAYRNAGATVHDDYRNAAEGAAVLFKVRRPQFGDDGRDELGPLADGALVAALFEPFDNRDELPRFAEANIIACAMELMPRITRAQSMDVLSSQSNLAGYKAVLDAASVYGHALPMMMTAAGTVPPAKAFVMGAGVAGLQAIATARRLGAQVTATDVRPAAKEQVESLGASFIAVEDEEFKQAETAGGYAKEMSADYQKKQADLIASHIAKQDLVITTALIPGRPAPRLISREMVESMKTGAVIVDIAAERGGNCELTQPGEVITHQGVTIVGHRNVAARVPADASALYARNLLNFLTPLVDKESGNLAIDWDDDIIKGVALTRDRQVIHPSFTDAPPAATDAAQAQGADADGDAGADAANPAETA